MMRATPDPMSYPAYLNALIGSTIMAVSEEEYSVCLHMACGHTMEICGLASGGFSINVLLPKERH